MIVTVSREGETADLHEGVAAVVRERNGAVRLCRDGQPDEVVDSRAIVVVTP